VTFAGPVAGRGLVVVLHADGVRTEYEPVRVLVSRGAPVRAGVVLGRVAGTHGSCAPGRCLHWGARRGADYLDPLLLLRALGTVRLLPWTGRP
jgi:murein DD-endopeptidase MepM/ murein hydrolase activator NlpD